MDYQTAIVPIYAQDQDALLARAMSVLKRARNLGMRIIHVQVGFHRNLPEISPRNPLLSAIKNSERHWRMFEGAAGAIYPTVASEGDDVIVTHTQCVDLVFLLA